MHAFYSMHGNPFIVCSWSQTSYLVFESEHQKGGHFAAHEKPEELVGDVRRMFGRGGGAFGVVKGKDGYASLDFVY